MLDDDERGENLGDVTTMLYAHFLFPLFPLAISSLTKYTGNDSNSRLDSKGSENVSNLLLRTDKSTSTSWLAQ